MKGKNLTQIDQGCTFYDPTDLFKVNDKLKWTEDLTIAPSLEKTPVVTHLHGMEVRPVYDGNPLSWFTKYPDSCTDCGDKDDNIGVGFLSEPQDEKYFDIVGES